MLKDFIKVELPDAINSVLSNVEKVKSILFVNETVREDSQDLMKPQSNSLFLSLQLLFVSHADTVNDPGEVTQIEKVM